MCRRSDSAMNLSHAQAWLRSFKGTNGLRSHLGFAHVRHPSCRRYSSRRGGSGDSVTCAKRKKLPKRAESIFTARLKALATPNRSICWCNGLPGCGRRLPPPLGRNSFRIPVSGRFFSDHLRLGNYDCRQHYYPHATLRTFLSNVLAENHAQGIRIGRLQWMANIYPRMPCLQLHSAGHDMGPDRLA